MHWHEALRNRYRFPLPPVRSTVSGGIGKNVGREFRDVQNTVFVGVEIFHEIFQQMFTYLMKYFEAQCPTSLFLRLVATAHI